MQHSNPRPDVPTSELISFRSEWPELQSDFRVSVEGMLMIKSQTRIIWAKL